jgi:hypothetical protein
VLKDRDPREIFDAILARAGACRQRLIDFASRRLSDCANVFDAFNCHGARVKLYLWVGKKPQFTGNLPGQNCRN